MTFNSGDPKLEALDEVEAALRKIYDAKRDGTATAQDDIRLKKLHVEWMAVMRQGAPLSAFDYFLPGG